MSLFGSLMGDFEDDILGNHMNAMNMQMRSMNRLMNSLMPDPFNMLTPFDPGFQQNAIMERPQPMGGLFGFPAMPNMNRLLSADIGSPNGAAYCSSSVISMSSGPDGRPQIYQATSSTKTGPGGVRETRKTVQDSMRGVKKMAIGHHIGDRSHIIEKEQDLRSGQLEERQEFINLDEEEADKFDREFTSRAHMNAPRRPAQQMLTIEALDSDDEEDANNAARHGRQLKPSRRQLPALPAPPSSSHQQQQQQQHHNSSTTSPSAPPKHNIASASLTTSIAPPSTMSTTASSVTSRANANVININGNTNYNNNNNTNYLNTTTPRRAYRNSHLISGIMPRRQLRTPTSSPLATTPPTNHVLSTAASPSVHPHPYNASAARRNYRAKHTKQHQQQQANNTNSSPATSSAQSQAATTKSKYDDYKN